MRELSLSDKICLSITSVAGIGYMPFASGTWACLAAVYFFALIKTRFYFFIATIITIILSYLCCSRAENIYGEKDSKKIVIDDFAGMLISLLFIPRDFKFVVIAFFLFRALDLIKIPPANRLEECPGACGIVGDDVVAGLYSCFILGGVRAALKIFS
ncbi:MAG: phosphatidylglycerophosphatase A [Candidatus Omnitrophica bacterium]|nr:phosphatidylglycerophosphatase A [Candidatus Omnitrophota bacterium]